MRLSTGLLLVLLCGPAVAQSQQPPAPPAPRVTLDVALPPPPDHRLSGLGGPGRLAVGADGALYVATSSFQPSPDGVLPAKSARIELLAYGRDGKTKYRTTLPVQAGDCYVLCSDGLSNYVSVEEVGQVLSSHFYRDVATVFVDMANERGGDDNVTCLCIYAGNEAPGI